MTVPAGLSDILTELPPGPAAAVALAKAPMIITKEVTVYFPELTLEEVGRIARVLFSSAHPELWELWRNACREAATAKSTRQYRIDP